MGFVIAEAAQAFARFPRKTSHDHLREAEEYFDLTTRLDISVSAARLSAVRKCRIRPILFLLHTDHRPC